MSTTEGLALLRAPFPPNQISKLPKPKSKDAPKGHCNVCGGWHGLPAVHLDYVGHAALTDRLLDVDPQWQWEPLSLADGLPVMDGYGGMWIKLTVCGVTRLGYGHAGDKSGGDAIKEVIGDALRNAAMRFGAALDLWHKGDLHAHDEDTGLERDLKASIVAASEKKIGALAAAAEDAAKNLDGNVKSALSKLARESTTDFETTGVVAAFDRIEEQGLNGDEKTFLWGMLNSKLRSALKAEGQHRAMASVPA